MYRYQFTQAQDPRLGRHVHHDPLSRHYRVQAAGEPASVQHERHAPVWDQGWVGSCTGHAALGCMVTGPFFAQLDETETRMYPLDSRGAMAIYSDATALDGFPGTYPPDDTGSDGLSVAKVLKNAGIISGYQHAFGIADLLGELQHRPCIVGTAWLSGMNTPDAEGIVRWRGAELGGHEYVCDGYEATRGLVWFTNSWGPEWGKDGHFAMPAEDFAKALDRDGDATFFVPADQPEPSPIPDPKAGADDALWLEVGEWASNATATASARVRRELRNWASRKGLTR